MAAAKASLTQNRLEEELTKLIIRAKLDGTNSDGDILMQPLPNKLGVNIDYAYDVNEKEIDKIARALDRKFGIIDIDDDTKSYIIGKTTNKKRLRFRKQKKGSGRIKTAIQEEGTTIVLENVLNGNADFKTHLDIMKHDKTSKALLKCFKGYEHLLDNWIWTFFQQQEQFIHEYSKKKWSTFEYGKEKMDFVTFFSKKILPKLSRSGGGKADAGKYTGWSPSDVWAVRNKEAVQKRLKGAIDDPTPQSLIEINTILVELMEKNPPQLVGISLKMIKWKNNAHIRLFNVDNSPILKKLKSFIPLESYTMKDIKFEPDNIINLKSVTTYIRYKSNKFYIGVTRSGSNVSFGTQIKGAAAQGGQTPIYMVFALLDKGTGRTYFKKENSLYPQDVKKFNAKIDNYKPMWELVSKHCKNKTKMTWEQWVSEMNALYARDKRDAIVTLMELSFWYESINKFSKNNKKSAEFWTDMLYFGMKITMRGQFAPHAKIS